jgi:hypothetical protein
MLILVSENLNRQDAVAAAPLDARYSRCVCFFFLRGKVSVAELRFRDDSFHVWDAAQEFQIAIRYRESEDSNQSSELQRSNIQDLRGGISMISIFWSGILVMEFCCPSLAFNLHRGSYEVLQELPRVHPLTRWQVPGDDARHTIAPTGP